MKREDLLNEVWSRECSIEVYIDNWCKIVIIYMVLNKVKWNVLFHSGPFFNYYWLSRWTTLALVTLTNFARWTKLVSEWNNLLELKQNVKQLIINVTHVKLVILEITLWLFEYFIGNVWQPCIRSDFFDVSEHSLVRKD